MKKSSLLITFVLSAPLFLLAQKQIPVTAYYQKMVSCNGMTNTTKEFTVVLYDDHTIKISTYSSGSKDYYTTIARNQYFGRYSINGDTLKIVYLSSVSEIKNKEYIPANSNKEKKVTGLTNNPPQMFVLEKKGLFPVDKPYPYLAKVNFSETEQADFHYNNFQRKTYKVIGF